MRVRVEGAMTVDMRLIDIPTGRFFVLREFLRTIYLKVTDETVVAFEDGKEVRLATIALLDQLHLNLLPATFAVTIGG